MSLKENLKQIPPVLIAFRALKILYKKRNFDQIVIHRRDYTKLPASVVIPLFSRHLRNQLGPSDDLTIVLVHNYPKPPIMEQSLHYVGIHDFVVLTPPKAPQGWHHGQKIQVIHEYLQSGKCKTPYVLYCDSDDAILQKDPRLAIDLLKKENCDLLFSETAYPAGYECMPDVQEWADQNAAESGSQPLYINSGVYIGKTEFMKEVFADAVQYVTDDALPITEHRRLQAENRLQEVLTEYPKRCASCQEIFRYLHPKYYPRMKIDYKEQLALR
ncbi:hypothetical protein SAMN05421823_102210 [Catalinimonas alkaloidigena]|uniref:Uncharacterized protein n=1 Tax=Catalinimonas alkaloidigena TaxID=1075417 RepID=A0A1G9AAC5_9BACT|nr:hypothetical protein [Catalinimonas alkaloidigena]SDK23555.1 hypothetical protein SAMN05421823_102210 [Catalinimonas alkaloidigena]